MNDDQRAVSKPKRKLELNRSEIQDVWNRMLGGQPLSSEDLAAFDAKLLALSQEEFEVFAQDLETSDLLRAISVSDDADRQAAPDTDRIVQQVKMRISAASATEPSPVQPPTIVVSDRHERQSRLDGTKRSKSIAGWIIAASAASVLFVVITTSVFRSNRTNAVQQAFSDPSSAQQPATSDPQQIAAVAENPVAENPNTATNESLPGKLINGQPPARPLNPMPDALVNDSPAEENKQVAENSIDLPSGHIDDSPKFVESSIQERLNSTQPKSPVIAVVTGSENAIWDNDRAPGKDLQAGPLSLVSGSAVMQLAKGAQITLHGPVELKLMDENQVALQSGQMEAFVPPAAVGFEVQTPGARIVDLGTKFRVHTQPENESTQVEVLKGTVEIIQSLGRRNDRERKYQLTAGQTKWLSYDATLAFDWRLEVQFGDPVRQPNQLSIDGQPFDVSRPDEALLAMQQVNARFANAGDRISNMPRGERFSGLLLINGNAQKLASTDRLQAARSLLFQQIQQRWQANLFQQMFPQGMPAEMEDFFKINRFPIPGENR